MSLLLAHRCIRCGAIFWTLLDKSGHWSARAHIANSGSFPAQSLKQGTKRQISTTSSRISNAGPATIGHEFRTLDLGWVRHECWMRRGTSAGRGKGEIALVRGTARGERVDYAPCANRGGGEGHAYPEPTVRFYGTPEAAWRAVGVCLAYGLPILSLRRVWY